MWQRVGMVGIVAICAFLGGWSATQFNGWTSRAQAQAPGRELTANVVTDLVSIGDRFEMVAKKVSPAVVYVEARKPIEAKASGSAKVVEESGSGVLVRWENRRDYLVLTNNHVIAGAAPEQIIVKLGSGALLQPAQVWADPESDVALLSIASKEELQAAAMGNSDRLQVGNWVLAMGSPFGLDQTVTHGIISAKSRGQIGLGNTIRIKDFLQTDAAINPGSSGGPLLNLNGEIVGINTAIASPSGSNSGVSFSIPINLYRRIASQLLEHGMILRGYLGIQLAAGLEGADALKLGLDRVNGALVEIVYPNTPGAKAGLKAGDVVLEMNGEAIRNENHLINLISNTQPGKTINLVILRDHNRQSLSAVVGEWSKGQERLKTQYPNQP